MTPQKLIYVSKSWPNFVKKISNFQDKKRGTHFEWFVKFYLLSSPKYRLYYDEVWHSSEFVSQTAHVSKLQLPIPEQGYDLIGLTKDGFYEIIQCKYKNNINRNIVYEDIDSSIRVATATPAKNYVKSVKMCSNVQGITRDKDIDNQAVNINCILGGDFEKLDKDDFNNIKKVIDNKAPVFNRVELRDHQKNALKLIKEHFKLKQNSRGQIIHACGTGKTLTAYYSFQELNPKIAIYLVPSLQLITQTLNEWSKESIANKKEIFPFIVCSDKTNEKIEETDPKLWLQELGIKVSNNSLDIKNFLNSKKQRKVIFSTYQSGKILAENLTKLNITPDLCFFDEAHNTTSSKLKLFGHLLSDENLKIKQRLFLTATPKKLIGKNSKYYSMDDEETYGKVVDEITFKDAIEKLGTLNDYRIITQVVSDAEARKLLHINPFVSDQKHLSEESELKLIASALTIKKIIKTKQIKNIVSFHHRRDRAKAFANGINNIDKTSYVNTFYVDGMQSGTKRQRILSEFSNASPSLVANARCLSEGIDVPSIDSVIFVDPKQSTVSITQAIGRALRKPKDSSKGTSYIIVPTVIDNKNSKNIDESYQEILMVLRSMSEHDGRIVEYFRLMKEGKKPPIKFLDIESEYPIHDFNLEDFTKNLHVKAWSRMAKIGRRPFEHARQYARSLGLKSSHEWRSLTKLKTHPADIPVNPESTYKEWTNWYDFLGKEMPEEKVSFKELREYAINSDINKQADWYVFAKSEGFPNKFPGHPPSFYKDEFTNWYDFLGNNQPVELVSYEELKKYLKENNINTAKKYRTFSKSKKFPASFPSAPNTSYKEFISWNDLFGKNETEYASLGEMKEFIQNTSVNSETKWRLFVKSKDFPKNFATNPNRSFKQEWISWYDFFGKTEPIEFISLKELKDYIKGTDIDTLEKYSVFVNSIDCPKNFPKQPHSAYKEWISFYDFFGKQEPTKNYRSYENAKKYACDSPIKSLPKWREAFDKDKLPDDLPKNPNIVYAKTGWTNTWDFFGKSKVANRN